MQINFYQLTISPLGKALPRLLEKVITSDKRAIVLVQDEEKLDKLNNELWTYTTKFFLPHGSKKDGFIEKQPIYLTTEQENHNNSTILVFVGNSQPDNFDGFEKCLYMFDGNNENELNTARQRWKEYKAGGINVTYWKQNEKGGWVEAA